MALSSQAAYSQPYPVQALSGQCKPHELVSMLEAKYGGEIAAEAGKGVDQTFIMNVPSDGYYTPKLRLELIVDASGDKKIFVMPDTINNNGSTTGFEYNPVLDPKCDGLPSGIYNSKEVNGSEVRVLADRFKLFKKEFVDQFSVMINRAYAHLAAYPAQNDKRNRKAVR